MSDLKVRLALTGEESTEPYIRESFIAGYESSGLTWSGDLDIVENQNTTELFSSDYADCDIVTYNSIASGLNYQSNYFGGTQYFIPAGSNSFRGEYNTEDEDGKIRCGSGYVDNATAYRCDFWDIDPYSGGNVNLEWIKKGSTVFPILGITRWAANVIGLQIPNDASTQFFEHGIPIRISGLTGTDISPLPSGQYILTYGSPGLLLFSYTPTSGTISQISFQTPGAGDFKVGTADNRILLRATYYGFWGVVTGVGITLQGITGFDNNPDGSMGGYQANYDGFGDKFELAYAVGSGSYTSGGTVRHDTESYSTPYMAGKFAALKDLITAYWGVVPTNWQVRWLLKETASENGVFHSYNGYGQMNLVAALAYALSNPTIPEDPNTVLGSIGEITIEEVPGGDNASIGFDAVTNALSYIIYRDDEVYEEGLTSAESIVRSLPKIYPYESYNRFSYKATNPYGETEKSTVFRYLNYKFSGILTKKHISLT